MNRREIKLTARQRASEAGKAAKLLTLLYLLCRIAILALQYAGEYMASHTSSGHYLSDTVAAGARSLLLSVGISLILQLFGIMLFAGYTGAALNIHRQGSCSPASLLDGFRIPMRVILLEVMETLLLIVWCYAFSLPVTILIAVPLQTISASMSAEALSGVFLALVLGLTAVVMLIVSYRYRTALFLLIDHPELSPWQCLRTASAMTRGHRMELFLLDLSFLPWILLSLLTAGILLIWKMPYMAAAYAGTYEALLAQLHEKQQRAEELRRQFPPHP